MNLSKTGFLAVLAAVSLAFAGCKGSNGASGASGTSCSTRDNGDGTVTISCTDGTSATVSNGAAGSPGADGTSCTLVGRTITCGTSSITLAGGVVDYTLLSAAERADALPSIVVTGVDFSGATPVVTFKVSDRKGNGLAGFTKADPLSTATPPGNNAGNFRLGLLKLVPGNATSPGVNGSANDTWVSYNSADAVHTGSAVTASATTLKEPAGDGTYVYTFPATGFGGTTYDANATHRLAIIMSASGNPYQPVNVVQDFVPATGADVTGQNDKVDGKACLECHTRFRAAAGGTGLFHSGQRYEVRGCVACHNDQRRFTAIPGTGTTPRAGDADITAAGTWTGELTVVNGEAVINLPVFIHKLHMGEDLKLQGGAYTGVAQPYEHTYPQAISNCAKCHRPPAPFADNWKTQPSRRACGACHDNVSFNKSPPLGAGDAPDLGRVAHSGGSMTDDSTCAACHTPTGSVMAIVDRHTPVASPDPNSIYSGGTNANTNAAYLAAAGTVPQGAAVITYDVQGVSRDATTGNPVIVFKLKKDGQDVVFNTYATGGELITGFVGSPSVYFAWALPEDGIAAPADFNASASGYVKSLWATGGAALSGPDGSGYYTAALTSTVIPATATMLTGGVGYTYSLTSTQPLTQLGLAAYPYDTATKVGGLIVPAPNVWKVAAGYTGRRAIVDTARCNACHANLGAIPTFHAGQRNDAPTCSFCHNPNRTSSAWSANAKDFVHSIHGADHRTVPFTWQASSATGGYWLITYPGVLNSCEMCHLPETYDYSAPDSEAAVPNLLSSTVGQGRYNASPTLNPSGWFRISPYVTGDNSVDYGLAYSTSNQSYTLPDGISGTQGATACTPSAPCVCTAANPCSITVGTTYTVSGIAASFRYNVTGGATCTDAAPCTCVTNPATGAATNCVATLRTCSGTAPCDAQGTTLVKTPITAACSACHDSPLVIDHMQSNGGRFYEPRSASLPAAEQCLLCHGKGKLAAIADVHK